MENDLMWPDFHDHLRTKDCDVSSFIQFFKIFKVSQAVTEHVFQAKDFEVSV